MIKQLSTAYSKKHCTCYDAFDGDTLVAVMVEPENGYKLRYNDGKDSYDISGFALVNVRSLDTFGCYVAVEESTITPTEADEISDTEALAIITGGNGDDES